MATYQIRVKGRLDQQWADWFDGLRITCGPDGSTLLAGEVADQAQLHGLLARVRDLGLELASVSLIEADLNAAQEG
ncbi:MAG TPA: hypothetical protein PKA95_02310 [Thermomicrobiales bacterium]|nr:hypothetical protein [Thermomicrobiales bacterium]